MSLGYRIGKRDVGPGHPPFVILEAGINHNGDLALARQMIGEAKRLNADAIKFQTFKAEEFVSDPTLTYTYRSQGREVTESMLDMFKRHEFAPEQWRQIKEACDTAGILFLSTPQNETDLALLLDLGVPAVKIGSDDFTNIPLITNYAAAGLPLILSCGMAEMSEVAKSIAAVGSRVPLALLVCTSEYPTPPTAVNVARVRTLMDAFPDVVIGFSDHTEGAEAAIMAAALGASIFEKHFTMGQDLLGPDHWFSANAGQAKVWIDSIRTADIMRGNGDVQPSAAEIAMRKLARRSLTLLKDVAAGDVFTRDNLGLRRPGDGLPPAQFSEVIGRRARRALPAGSQLAESDIG